jgi:hypothetical protein
MVILIEYLTGLLHFLEGNTRMVPPLRHNPFHIISSSELIGSTIRRFIFLRFYQLRKKRDRNSKHTDYYNDDDDDDNALVNIYTWTIPVGKVWSWSNFKVGESTKACAGN